MGNRFGHEHLLPRRPAHCASVPVATEARGRGLNDRRLMMQSGRLCDRHYWIASGATCSSTKQPHTSVTVAGAAWLVLDGCTIRNVEVLQDQQAKQASLIEHSRCQTTDRLLEHTRRVGRVERERRAVSFCKAGSAALAHIGRRL